MCDRAGGRSCLHDGVALLFERLGLVVDLVVVLGSQLLVVLMLLHLLLELLVIVAHWRFALHQLLTLQQRGLVGRRGAEKQTRGRDAQIGGLRVLFCFARRSRRKRVAAPCAPHEPAGEGRPAMPDVSALGDAKDGTPAAAPTATQLPNLGGPKPHGRGRRRRRTVRPARRRAAPLKPRLPSRAPACPART